jgi:arginyl-tRNA synthetase
MKRMLKFQTILPCRKYLLHSVGCIRYMSSAPLPNLSIVPTYNKQGKIPSILDFYLRRVLNDLYPDLADQFPSMNIHITKRGVANALDYASNIAFLISKKKYSNNSSKKKAVGIDGIVPPSTTSSSSSKTVKEIAAEIVQQLNVLLANSKNHGLVSIYSQVSSSPDGLVQFHLSDDWMRSRIDSIAKHSSSISENSSSIPSINVSMSTPQPLTPPSPPSKMNILIDFASPNMGKALHVGHLRSSVIGDSLANILSDDASLDVYSSKNLAPAITRISHVGDCGLPVAIVITYVRSLSPSPPWLVELMQPPPPPDQPTPSSISLPSPTDLSLYYEHGKKKLDKDPVEFNKAVHSTLRELQSVLCLPESPLKRSHPLIRLWEAICKATRNGYEPIFARLGVHVTEFGEAMYVNDLEPVCKQLLTQKVAVEFDGAVGIFVDGEDKSPYLIRRGDGGFLYAAIDLAALKRRLIAGFERIIYVTDSAQNHHFQSLFKAAKMAEWIDAITNANLLHPDKKPVQLDHVSFGVVTGEGGAKLSSRDGTELTLENLLNVGTEKVRTYMQTSLKVKESEVDTADHVDPTEDHSSDFHHHEEHIGEHRETQDGLAEGAIEHATNEALQKIINLQKGNLHDPTELASTADAIATSSIRYFDLAHSRKSSYAFSYDKVLAFRGNTGVYLMYATTRLLSLKRLASAYLIDVIKEALNVIQSQHSKDQVKSATSSISGLNISKLRSFLSTDLFNTKSKEIQQRNETPIIHSLSLFLRDSTPNGLVNSIKFEELVKKESGYEYTWEDLIFLCDSLTYSNGAPSLDLTKSPNDTHRATHHAFSHPTERTLNLMLLRYPEALSSSAESLLPHVLAEYLFDLSSDFSRFYASVRILPSDYINQHIINSEQMKNETIQSLSNKLKTCSATDAILRRGCRLLGVKAVTRM